MSSRVVIWSIVALVFGATIGCLIGYNMGYDQAAVLLAVK